MFPSSILLLAFILMCFTLFPNAFCVISFSLFYFCFHFIFLFTKLSHHRCNIHFSFISLSIYIGICVTCIVSLHFWTHAFIIREKICAMELSLFRGRARAMISHFFCNRWRLCYSFHMRTMCFVLHSFRNVEFICNLYTRPRRQCFSLYFSNTSIFFCNISQWPRHAVDCIEGIHTARWLYAFILLLRIKNLPLKPHSLILYERKYLQNLVCMKKMWTTWNTYVRAAKNIYMKHL